MSLPYWGYTFYFKLRLPVLGSRKIGFKINGFKKHQFNGQHYWEIGKHGYPLAKIKHEINKVGFKTIKAFWDIDDPYHYYFVLEKLD